MGEANRRGTYDARRAKPKGTAWRRTIRPTMIGALTPLVETQTGRWWPNTYRPGERMTYSDGVVMVADRNGSLRRVSHRRFDA